MKRRSGILLHPTSLPGKGGIGTIGEYAYKFIDWLKSAGQTLWQILPLTPTGYGDSPYSSFSTFAGNPLLIDLDMLVKDGFLDKKQSIPPEYVQNTNRVDFGAVVYWKIPLLKTASKQFKEHAKPELLEEYTKFKTANKDWLYNYASFMSIKEFYDEKARNEKVCCSIWNEYWPTELALFNEEAVSQWNRTHKIEVESHCIIQFFFYRQWSALKEYAHKNGINIIGDIPIFVAMDSADAWSNQHLFQLDKNGKPKAVAGVPPDYFSATGQLWGNPLYDWDAMQKEHFSWWLRRIKKVNELVDFIRIDHFRGFDAYWRVPAGEETAVNGEWIKTPGKELFQTIQKKLGNIPIIAEDLGVITEDVTKLREEFGLPGMKVLQFAFSNDEVVQNGFINPFMPHMYSKNCVVYTGTHDNSTTMGYLSSLPEADLKVVCKYLGFDFKNSQKLIKNGTLCRSFIKQALSSVADFAVIPMQDILELGDEARMNMPSTAGGHNWQWRLTQGQLTAKKAVELKELSYTYGRNSAE